MTFLKTIDEKHFHQSIPPKPMGKYAHIVTCRITESYPLFQTDGALNTARVRAGKRRSDPITRLVIFKRKQSSPERLAGRELLRNYGLVSMSSDDGDKKKKGKAAKGAEYGECDYNVSFCQRCADCILYGFAIGDSGSEKSKVVVDTAYSITPFEDSHIKLTLNAPFEDGTMSRGGETTSRINSQDHVIPQVFFPSIVTIKDPTQAGFLYVMNNLLRTKHYGAQTTRTGRVRNLVLGAVLADGEITSNLRLTQAVYDLLSDREQISAPDPIQEEHVVAALSESLPALLEDDGVVYDLVIGERFDSLMKEARALTQDEAGLKALLSKVNDEANEYARTYVETAS
ncbi:MAG: type I-D CRISPR-associated protein Cas7/Csc2 [Blastocatellia bacterium]|nr:type I-D CRISPR-associated protein Cas7/Csc2 [Blastocatellia bacterium]